MRAELEKVREKAKELTYHPRVYSEEYHKPPTVAANWVPELISIAGGTPMSKPGILSYRVTAEQVNAFDPDMIVLHWCGFGVNSRSTDVCTREGWEGIRAVTTNTVRIVDDMFLNRPGPRLWKGAVLLHEEIKRLGERKLG